MRQNQHGATDVDEASRRSTRRGRGDATKRRHVMCGDFTRAETVISFSAVLLCDHGLKRICVFHSHVPDSSVKNPPHGCASLGAAARPTPMADRCDPPSLSHATSYPDVYPPSMPDTVFFLDVLCSLKDDFGSCSVILEVACGAAPLAATLSLLHHTVSFASDVSASACQCASETASCNGIQMSVFRADMVAAFRPGLVDVLLCHPPYVPTTLDALEAATTTAAAGGVCASVEAATWTWAGGPGGCRLLERLIDALPTVLARDGFALVLWYETLLPEETFGLAARGLRSRVVSERRVGGEFFCILRIDRSASAQDGAITHESAPRIMPPCMNW